MGNLEKLKDLIFETDNNACFIERERILGRLEKEMQNYSGADKYAIVLSKLLAEVSTPRCNARWKEIGATVQRKSVPDLWSR